jgi:aspartate ammonia-lyase
MSCYAEAFGRDRWRVYKCEERLRVVNLGGTAIGTGLSAPRKYVFRVVDNLKALTGLGLARAENLVEATQNCDVYVEVSGILNACAANLIKTCGDLRLLSSGPDAGLGELLLEPRQAGSSIMPGKVNPVIPEAATQAAFQVQADSAAIFAACAAGSLELNAFLPLVADRLLNSLKLLAAACETLASKCVDTLEANEAACRRHVEGSTATVTALVGPLGYEKAQEILKLSKERSVSIKDAAIASGLAPADFDALISPEAVMRLGS